MQELLLFLKQDFSKVGWSGYKESYRALTKHSRWLLLGIMILFLLLAIVGSLHWFGLFESLSKRKESIKSIEREVELLSRQIEDIHQEYQTIEPYLSEKFLDEMSNASSLKSSAEFIRLLENIAQQQNIQILQLEPIEADSSFSSPPLSAPLVKTFTLQLESCGEGLSHLLFLDDLLQSTATHPGVNGEFGEWRIIEEAARCKNGTALFHGKIHFKIAGEESLKPDFSPLLFKQQLAAFKAAQEQRAFLTQLRERAIRVGRDPFKPYSFVLFLEEERAVKERLETPENISLERSKGAENQITIKMGENYQGITFIGVLEQNKHHLVLLRNSEGHSKIVAPGEEFLPHLYFWKVKEGELILRERP